MRNRVLVWRADTEQIFTRRDAEKNIQRNMTIGTQYRSIGDGAFRGNIKLKKLDLSENIEEIGQEAFLNCTKIKNINIPGIQKVRKDAFAGCASLEEINFAKKMIILERNAFSRCKRLSRVHIQETALRK